MFFHLVQIYFVNYDRARFWLFEVVSKIEKSAFRTCHHQASFWKFSILKNMLYIMVNTLILYNITICDDIISSNWKCGSENYQFMTASDRRDGTTQLHADTLTYCIDQIFNYRTIYILNSRLFLSEIYTRFIIININRYFVPFLVLHNKMMH